MHRCNVRFPPIEDMGGRLESSAMDPQFVLLHSLPETGRVKVVGIYSSRALAEGAMERTSILPGFAEEPEGFAIEQYEMNRDHWPRGFVRL